MIFIWFLLPLILVYAVLCLFPHGRLRSWHEDTPDEIRARHVSPQMSLEEYLQKEEQLFQPMHQHCHPVPQEEIHGLNRFCPNALSNPKHFTFALPEGCHSWNRTCIFQPADGLPLRGGVLLFHGMFDAPYSMRAVAEIYRDQGFMVLCPRLPGHGVQPGGLLSVTMEDWLAVAHLAARHLCRAIGQKPFLIGGFSNGAAVALGYTLDALESERVRTPDKLLFFSPGIGINPLAKWLNLHKLFSWMPLLNKFKWWKIALEHDPFKFRSMPNNAAYQASRITRRNKHKMRKLNQANLLNDMPDTLCFMSLIDDTVKMTALIEDFFDHLSPGSHELVVFDINRFEGYAAYMDSDCKTALERFGLDRRVPKNYKLTLISNASSKTHEVVARSREPGSANFAEGLPLAASWPPFVFSQTHISIPFKPDDPLYGDGKAPQYAANPDWVGPGDEGFPNLALGSLRPLGERAVSSLPAAWLNRLHYNVFFDDFESRLRAVARSAHDRQAEKIPTV